MAVTKVDTAEQFYAEYPRVRDWLISAMAYSDNEISEAKLLNGLVDREYQLWTTQNAACITSITEWEDKQVCCLFLIGGNRGKAMQEILYEGQPIVEAYAREHGCDGLLGIGRDLWKRVLPEHGFSVRGTIYFKEI